MTFLRPNLRAHQAQYGENKAAIVTYPGAEGAGHGILLQHPASTQEQIYVALTND